MKDAFGGAFMLRIMIVFFVIFVIFMSVAIQYTRAFRTKDGVINIIERLPEDKWDEQIENLVKSSVYKFSAEQYLHLSKHDCTQRAGDEINGVTDYYGQYGICIKRVGNDDSYYYRVYSYVYITPPLFNINAVYAISGETKTFIA